MAAALHAIDFLLAIDKRSVPAVCVVFGDEPFFKRLVSGRLRELVAGDDDDEFTVATLDSDAEARDVFDELATGSLFGSGRRLVIVDDADAFVTRNRELLEDYVAAPKSKNVLLLDVRTWPSNTRLYKAVASNGLQVECTAGPRAALTKWLVSWSQSHHGVKLQRAAAETLVDLVGEEVGLMAQELEKLAGAAGTSGEITPESVQKLVGSWRTQTAWEMLDAALAGDAPSALAQLDRLLLAGEEPIALLCKLVRTCVVSGLQCGSWSKLRATVGVRIFAAFWRRRVFGRSSSARPRRSFVSWAANARPNCIGGCSMPIWR